MMNIRDSDSSTDEEGPEQKYGHLTGNTGVAEAGSSSTHTSLQPILPDDEATSNRNSISGFSTYESARSSIFASAPPQIDRISTPSSPSLQSTRSSHTQVPFSGPSAKASRSVFMETGSPTFGATTVTAAEKDGDDPTAPLEDSPPGRHSTPTALTRLLAARTATSPTPSRNESYIDGNPNLIRHVSVPGSTSLHDHLYSRGLLEGKHSDIAVIAFGHRYALHRLILDRAPFFTSALSAPWLESTAKEVVLHPEEIDPTITQKAFELALKRLYGCDIASEEDAEAVGLFATGCWLEMADLVEVSISSILRQMGSETLSPLIRLVTNNYYGRAGDKILASAKAMLCRDGWEMPVRYWDEIPGEIVREIVGGDGFYVAGEWERWVLARRLLDRRLRQKAVEYGLALPGSRVSIIQAPEMLSRTSRRLSGHGHGHARTVSVESVSGAGSASTGTTEDMWTAIYTDPDIEPILVLMDHGIHYVHLDFERLQFIRQAKDIFGLSVLPEHVIQNALWQQMELRQRVVNARENDLELGLSQAAEIAQPPTPAPRRRSSSMISNEPASSKGKQKETSQTPSAIQEEGLEEEEEEDLTSRPRKFWIPSADCNIVMGGAAEPVITTNATGPQNFLRLSSGLPAGIDATDVLWASNFAGPSPSRAANRNRSNTAANASMAEGEGVAQPKPVAFSNIPPFRFAAEFPNPRGLKEKKRVYSRTVFYAGSHWNIYIQKVRSQKNPQLGVYLHRAKERDNDEGGDAHSFASTSTLRVGGGGAGGSVDERIGLLEREMLLRSSNDGRRVVGRRSVPTRHSEQDDGSMAAYRRRMYGGASGEADTSFTAFDSDSETDDEPSSGNDRPTNTSTNFLDEQPPTSASASTNTGASLTHFPPPGPARPQSLPTATGISLPSRQHSFQAKRIPTLPSYTDTRPTIKTYFKIYSPSKGGRLLSVYESAPDKFDFSQSWGWKSSTLMLDEGFSTSAGTGGGGVDVPGVTITSVEDSAGLGGADAGLAGEVAERERERRKRKEGALRFMVVIGNL